MISKGKLHGSLEEMTDEKTQETTQYGVIKKEKYQFGTFYQKDEKGEFVPVKGNKLDQSNQIWANLEEIDDLIHIAQELRKQLANKPQQKINQ